ncbi:hypothetical protein, partial [Curtobacterium oceanosedimentum]|uniref:hypothetical protein n=1 Tax=Curtobacterium oceanosedimentum TaxID=465820 RepID=UPI001CE167B3
MSHKKRASTAFKSMGAAGLAAATIVSGLSFGAPAVAASPDAPKAWTQSFSAKFVMQRGSSYIALKSDGQAASYSSLSAAMSAALTGTFPTPGTTGTIQMSNGNCIRGIISSYDWEFLNAGLRTTSPCSSFAVSADGQTLTPKDYSTYPYITGIATTPGGASSFKASRSASEAYSFKPTADQVNRALTASVTKTNNIAKTAVVAGTATPKGTVTIGSKTVNVADSGAWSMTVEGLRTGANSLTAVQKVNNAEVDRKPVTVNIVEGGTVVGVNQGPIELTRGQSTQVPFLVQNNESRTNMKGSVTLTAPAGTTFADGQAKVAAGYRSGTSGDFRPYTPLDLKNGVRSDGNTKITFDLDTAGGNMVAGEQYRYMLSVATPADAAAGSGQMGFTYAGDSSKGDYRAEGKTTTNLEVAQRELTAAVDSIDHAAGSAVLKGTATPGATIVIGEQSATANEDGDWSLEVTGLESGPNSLLVEQKIGNDTVDSKPVTVTINDAAIIGQDGPAATLERGERTKVQAQFETKGDVSRPDAQVTFTAPEGTTFAEGQNTIAGSYKRPGEDWMNRSATLTDGDLSMDGKTYTYTFKPTSSTWTLPDASLLRWSIDVETPAEIADGTPSMTTKLVGTAVEGSFDATSTTATTIESAETALTAEVESVDNEALTAKLTGTATKGSKVSVGTQSVDVTNDDGSWELTVTGLKYGENTLRVVQTIDGREVDDKQLTVQVDGVNREFKVTTPENESVHKGEMVTFSGEGRAGEEVRLHVTNFASTDVTTKVGNDGRWSVQRFLGEGTYVFDITQQNAAGTTTGDVRGLTINKPVTEDPVNKPWQVTAPTSGSQHRGEMVTWTGTGNAGDTVTFTPKNPEQSAWSTVVDNKGDWKVDRFAGVGAYDVDVAMKNAAGTETGAPINILLNQNVNLPFAVTSPENNSEHKGELVTFRGTGNAGEQIDLKVTNFDSTNPQPVRVDSTGHWKIEKFLGTGAYTIDITQTNLSTGLVTGAERGLRFNTPSTEDPVNKPWQVTAPTSGSQHRGEMVTWTGTGNAGDTVTFTPK